MGSSLFLSLFCVLLPSLSFSLSLSLSLSLALAPPRYFSEEVVENNG